MDLKEVREIQMAALDVLLEIDRVCKKNEIEYMLAAGTSLGCVRHQGFIPWDDDLDIYMTRDNYEKFVDVLSKELDDHYYYHCFATHPSYNVLKPDMKVRKKGTCLIERNPFLKHGCQGDGIFVDVFILDHLSEKKWVNFIFRMPMYLMALLIFILSNLRIKAIWLKRFFLNCAKWYDHWNKDSKKMGLAISWCFNFPHKQFVCTVDDLFPLQEMPFEGHLLPMPHHPDAILKLDIGDDYMTLPPENKRKPKHTLVYSVTSDYPNK